MTDTPPDLAREVFLRQMAGQSPAEIAAWMASMHMAPEDGWAIETAADALAPQPPLEYLIDQLLPAPCLAIVYGGPGSLKSMLMADMCVCVAAGVPWLDQLSTDMVQPGVTLTTTQAPVLWIDFDNGRRRTRQRIGALLRARNLGPDTPMHHVSMPVPHLDASRDVHVDALAARIRAGGYRLVVVDNLGLITGDVEENSAAMANVMGHLRRLVEETSCALILIHHQRKSGSNGDSNGIRKGETLRGHSSIEAALDLALLVERKAGEDVISILPTKVRDFLGWNIIGARFTYEHAEASRDLWTARFFSEATMSKEDAAAQALDRTIIDIARSTPGILQKALLAEAQDTVVVMPGGKVPGPTAIRRAIKRLVTDGHLEEGGNGSERRYWAKK